jgi:sugar (glycoside-pentoside-hexuronide) transporter
MDCVYDNTKFVSRKDTGAIMNAQIEPIERSSEVEKSLYIKIPFMRKVLYNLGDVGNSFSWGFVASFLVIFYTDVFGISAAAVSLMLLISRLWDGLNDPIVGIMADRTVTKWGRYRPWILFGMVPLAIFTVLTFWAHPEFSPSGKLIYAYITYFFLSFFNTCVIVPHASLISAMTQDPNERSKLAGMRMAFGFIGNTIVGILVVNMVPFFGQGDNVKGYLYTAFVMAFVLAIPMFTIDFLGTKEVVNPPRNQLKVSTKKLIAGALKNKYLIMCCVAIFIVGLGHYTRMTSLMYYFTYVIRDRSLIAGYMLFLNLPFVAGALSASLISKKLGNKGKTFAYASFSAGISMILGFWFTPIDNPMAFYTLAIMTGFFTGIMGGSAFSMVPDTVEYGQLITGERTAGFNQSFTTFWNTIGIAIGSAGVALMLSILGYIPNVDQTASVLNGIRMTMFVFPGIITFFGGIMFLFYKLDFVMFDRIVSMLQAESDK